MASIADTRGGVPNDTVMVDVSIPHDADPANLDDVPEVTSTSTDGDDVEPSTNPDEKTTSDLESSSENVELSQSNCKESGACESHDFTESDFNTAESLVTKASVLKDEREEIPEDVGVNFAMIEDSVEPVNPVSDEKTSSNLKEERKSSRNEDNATYGPEVSQADEEEERATRTSTSESVEPASNKVEELSVTVVTESASPSNADASKSPSATSDYFSATPDNEDSMQSTGCSSSASEDPSLADLPKEMIDEERRFARETAKELKANANAAPLDIEERQKRYKVLMSLLGKSKEYANYMSEKLTSSKESAAEETEATAVPVSEPETPQNVTTSRANRKRKSAGRGSDDASLPKRTKVQLEEPTYNAKTHYKNAMGLVVSRRQPSLLTGGIMRDYQLDGLEWMVALYKNGVNGILADEMGLGKTIQVISLLCHLREKRVYGPHLIIGPLSTLPNWIFEFANFAPDIPVALFHGPEEKRNEVIKRFVDAMPKKHRAELPVLITSYEMPLRDKRFLSAVKWGSIIVDEGHRLKNYQSMLSQALKCYKTDYRLLLTGTPLQNNIKELWSLLNYLIPEIFDNLTMFENLFDFSDLKNSEKQNEFIQREKEEQLISKMHQILEPFLLRRIKTDVCIALPSKKEILVKAPLTSEQEELYKAVLDKTITGYEPEPEIGLLDGKKKKRSCAMNKTYSEEWDIDEDAEYLPKFLVLPTSSKKKRKRSANEDIEYVFDIKLTSPFMMLRKIVNHPYLVKTPVVPGTRDIIVDEKLIQQSGKLLVLDALLPRLKANGHKVLLFSTFRIMLDLVEDYVIMRKYKYRRLDGLTSIESRLEHIKAFNTDPDTFVFLISTRAGGLGINLTAADTVIIYDSDWNPQVDLQAQDRCHRIGQTRPVVVYRLVTAGTIDEHIMNTALYKRRLEKLIVKKGKFKQKASEDELSLAELREVLESTDYKQVIHANGLVLSDEEIERLVDRSDLLDDTAAATTVTTVQTPTAVATSSRTGTKKSKVVKNAKSTPRQKGENQR